MIRLAPLQIFRFGFGLLALGTIGLAINYSLHRQSALGIKLGWVAAIFAMIALGPEKLPFFITDLGVCLFFRNAFGAMSVVLTVLGFAVVLLIQLPQEKIPRFHGRVVDVAEDNGRQIPRIEFHDATGTKNNFDDRLAPTIFPQHAFWVGERVIVRAPVSAPPHVDHSAFARWSTTIFLFLVAALTLALTIGYHVRSGLLIVSQVPGAAS